jgi:hypothetical protein
VPRCEGSHPQVLRQRREKRLERAPGSFSLARAARSIAALDMVEGEAGASLTVADWIIMFSSLVRL